MAETYWPFDNADTTEQQYSSLFRRLQHTGVWGNPDGNELKPFTDATGLNIKVPAGLAFVRGWMYNNDTTKTLAVAAGESQPRIDRVILRVDPAANTILALLLKGDASATPQAKALTQTEAGVYEISLATLPVAASASTFAPTLPVDERTFMGHVYGLWNTDRRPATPRLGQPGFNNTLKIPEYWNGTDWVPYGFSAAEIKTLVQAEIKAGQAFDSVRVNTKQVKIQQAQPAAYDGRVAGDLWISW